MSRTRRPLYSERRKSKRNSAVIKVYLSGGFGRYRGITRDISRRGAFVITDHLGLASGSRFDLMFVQSAPKVVRIRRYTVEVTRRTIGGVGLVFCSSPHLNRLAETAWLRKNQ